ncbi:ribosome assembly factor SBDS [Candidatus Woesearchaeota archaeon]|nr:MAG: ribosome assembly factor SBDS [Candidatus Woesearchaeota archaeon]
MSRITYDAEKVTFNLAKIRKGGENFEVAIDPDLIVNYKSGKETDVKDILKSEKIFFDVKKGQLASEDKLKEVFGTTDVFSVSKRIFDEGEIQFTAEYRQKLQEEKRKKIIDLIHRKGVDPKTGLPHPTTRIENAFEEAKIRIDYFKKAEEQVEEIVKKIRIILPIRFETKKIEVKVGPEHSSKIYGVLQNYGKIIEQNWLNDGGLQLIIELPAGIVQEFFDKLNNMTHGQNETREIGE